jgi:hypothetical protein
MLLTDITKIIRVLLGTFGAVASQDALTQRRVGQIGEVIGAVEDVAGNEEDEDGSSTIAERRVEEAHDIIHRVAVILAMEEENDGTRDGNAEDDMEAEATAEQEDDTGQNGDELLVEVPWDGTLNGETIELKEDEE